MKWVKNELATNSRHGLRQGVMETDLTRDDIIRILKAEKPFIAESSFC
jgi:hypothetical protein